ncbi:MAG TPA: hypothetical protein VMZ03_08980 [Chitinophagaceae bacterium]|nr:hypothetical protein [Chitinophagaceae bacterium]
MKQQSHPFFSATGSPLSLQHLVDSLVNDRLQLAKINRTAVVNEIGKAVSLSKGCESFICLIDEVITTVIANSNRGDIHISAERRDKEVILSIQERNNYNGYALSFSIGTLMEDAFSIGGMLDIKGPQKKITTIYLSLPVTAAA